MIFLRAVISNTKSFDYSGLISVHVSQPYKAICIIKILYKRNLVATLIFLSLQMFSNSPIVFNALADLILISDMLSPYVKMFPYRYLNSLTSLSLFVLSFMPFSILLYVSASSQRINSIHSVLVLPISCHSIPLRLESTPSRRLCASLSVSAMSAISSANRRLLLVLPLFSAP